MTQRIEHLFSKMTQRIQLFLIWLKELNPFFNTTRRIEPFFLQYDAENWSFCSWIWRRELNLLFLNMTQRIEPFFLEYDSKSWTFFMTVSFLKKKWVKELNLFQYDSKNWISYYAFFNTTHRIEPWFYWIQHTELNLFFTWLKLFLVWLKELNLFVEYDSKNRTFFECDSKDFFFKKNNNTSQRIEFESKDWILFF